MFEYDSSNLLIAEDTLLELKERYVKINIFGIASSALIPFINCDWCEVYTIKSRLFFPECNSISDELMMLGIKLFDLDTK
jgi:hypothetical protein